jgi:hypothetical protein
MGKLAWRQHNRPHLHRRLTLRSPSGTLGMGVATQVTMRVVVITPLKVTPGLTSTSAKYPNWYAPLERYVSYGIDQAERAVEGIGRLERQIDDFTHIKMAMQASIDSQMTEVFGHFGINPDD